MNGDTQQIINKITEIATLQEERHKENKEDLNVLFKKVDEMNNHLTNLPCDVFAEKAKSWDKHIEESPNVRDTVRDNASFVASAKWALRAIYLAIIGIIAKMLFLK